MNPLAMRELREWMMYSLGSFMAGVLVTTVLALVVWKWGSVVRAVAKVRDGIWVVVWSASQCARETKAEEDSTVLQATGSCEMEKVETTTTPKKPFEFRDRLWNEPPEGFELGADYPEYEFLVVVQKEMKEMGGKDLEWKTRWLDLRIEKSLLSGYASWGDYQCIDKNVSESDKLFYRNLVNDLDTEHTEVRKETAENNRLHGETWERDGVKLRDLMLEVRARERQKKRA